MGYEVNKGVGKRSRQHGAEVAWNGGDVIIQSPVGVSVLTDGGQVLGDLVRDKDTVLVAMGGPGGSRETDYHGVRGEIF